MNKTTYYGSTIIYECDRNYILIGNKTRTCMELGIWSGLEPSCESKLSNEMLLLQ